MTNYEGMDAETFNKLFLEQLNTDSEPKAEVKNTRFISKMMEFGYRRVAVQDAHPNEPVCRVCLTFGHDKGIKDEYCPECRADPGRLMQNFLTENELKESKPSRFKEFLDLNICAKCSHSGHKDTEEKQLWCFLHKFYIPSANKISVQSFYQFTCDDAVNVEEGT